jgi:membrane protein
VVRQVAQEVERDALDLVAGGVAFFAFLAVFPALAALIATYGLVFDATHVETQVGMLDGLLPGSARALVSEQLRRLTQSTPDALSASALVGLAVAIWSANKGSRGVIRAINVAQDREETRGVIRLHLVALLVTAGAIVFLVTTLALAAGVPAVLAFAGLDAVAAAWVDYGRWPVLLVVVMSALATVYAIAPSRTPHWPRVTPGTIVATVALLAASGAFSAYVARFGQYRELYGSVGAVAVFLLWLYIASFVVLLGAEVDAVLQRAKSETTTGRSRSVSRGARAEIGARRHLVGARRRVDEAGCRRRAVS